MQLTKKQAQSRAIALMCSGHPITVCPPAPRPSAFTTHTGALVPHAEMFGTAYLSEFAGDAPVMPIYEDEGDWATEGAIAQKRGQEWRTELELQESGEIVGYWGEGI